jgi:glycosyltransferase involved in cell wall biosynthesis
MRDAAPGGGWGIEVESNRRSGADGEGAWMEGLAKHGSFDAIRREMKMRIVYLWDADYPWDVRTEKICKSLVEAGHDVHIVARNRAWRQTTEELIEGTVHRLRPWRWLGRRLDGLISFPAFFSPRWFGQLKRVARRADADVVIVRDVPLCPTAISVGRKLGIPVVLDMAENYPAMMRDIWEAGRQKPWDVAVRNPRLVGLVERWCLKRLDGVLVVVAESGDRLVRLGVPSSKITVVSNTPSRQRIVAVPAIRHANSDVLDIVYLGLLEIPRGVGDLLQAAALLRHADVRVRIRIIGDGRDRALLERRQAALGLDDGAVEFLGRLPHDEALRTVASAEIGIVPHHAREAWNTTIPNKLFDYMAAGLAVVSSDAQPPARILRETGAGLLFRSGDAKSLADALLRLRDPAIRRELGGAGREAIDKMYNWENDVQALLAALRGVVSRRGGHSTMAVDSPTAVPVHAKAAYHDVVNGAHHSRIEPKTDTDTNRALMATYQ